MDGEPDPGRADREPQAFAARRPQDDGVSRWRRAVSWLFRDREDIDQEGLLAERTMRVTTPRHSPGDDPEPGPHAHAHEPR
jgi:hypothetical protein